MSGWLPIRGGTGSLMMMRSERKLSDAVWKQQRRAYLLLAFIA